MSRLFLAGFVYLIWLLLTWPFAPVDFQELIAGVISVVLVVLFLGNTVKKWQPEKHISFKRIYWALLYIPVFIYYLVQANFDVMYRVFHPDVPINPGIVRVKTRLKSKVGRAVLCNSITLTPGTLSVDIIDDDIYVHWINISEKSLNKITAIIAGRFEEILLKVFE